MILSRITSKSQTTVPRAVRQALHLQPGDTLAYRIEDGEVRISKLHEAAGSDLPDPFAAFVEWADALDTEDFRDL